MLDVGGGAGHQSFPLARLGYDVTVLDPSEAMLAKARERLAAEPDDVRARVRLVQATGESAAEATEGRRFSAVLCHGVLMYVDLTGALARGAVPMCRTRRRGLDHGAQRRRPWRCARRWSTVGPRRWPASTPPPRSAYSAHRPAATPSSTSRSCCATGESRPLAWYGVWLFSDWMDLPVEGTDLEAVTARRARGRPARPLPQLSRVFHLLGDRLRLRDIPWPGAYLSRTLEGGGGVMIEHHGTEQELTRETPGVRQLPRLLTPFRHPAYRRLAVALTCGAFAYGVWMVALVWEVIRIGGGPAQLSIVSTAGAVGVLLPALLGGRRRRPDPAEADPADRRDRRAGRLHGRHGAVAHRPHRALAPRRRLVRDRHGDGVLLPGLLRAGCRRWCPSPT